MKVHNYILGSHNSWSFLKPTKWWMKLIGFTAKCQRCPIAEQYYTYGVRCFDLHIRFDDLGNVKVVHGPIEYDMEGVNIEGYFNWANEQNEDIYIRLILDVRTRKSKYRYGYQRDCFQKFCERVEKQYPKVKFWCGRMVTGWAKDFEFKIEPTCQECYGSVSKPALLDDWLPWLFARRNNKIIKQLGTTLDILLIDYVDIG